jgi:hypothetical protein
MRTKRSDESDRAKLQAYQALLNPPKKPVTADDFEQIIYDAIARDKTQPPAAILRWAHRHYKIVENL